MPPCEHQLSLSRRVEILARVDQGPGDALAQQAQAFEIVSQDRVFDPHQFESSTVDRLELDDRLFAAPRLVGVDHYFRAAADRLFEEIEPVQIPGEVWIANLDLESLVADGVGVAEKIDEIAVAQMVVEARSIGPDFGAPRPEKLVERQAFAVWPPNPKAQLEGLRGKAAYMAADCRRAADGRG